MTTLAAKTKTTDYLGMLAKAQQLIAHEVTITQLMLFLEVAQDEGNQRIIDIANRYGWTRASGSRSYRRLCKWEAPEQPGLDLVAMVKTEYNARDKYLELTTRGRKIYKMLVS